MKYTHLYLLALIIMSPFALKAQITQRNLLQNAAQQNLSQSLIPQDKFKPFPQTPEGWKQILPDKVISKLIEKGETALKHNFNDIPATVMLEYVRTGNRTDYETLSFEKRSWLQDLVMAEAVEGKGRFVDQIVNGVWSICEESFWGISAHVGIQKDGAGLPNVKTPIVDLFAAETGSLLAWTDYLVGPQLDKVSKLVRQRIRQEIDRRVLVPMTTAKYSWMGGGDPNARLNNWAPWVASNYITAALLTEQDEPKRRQALNIAIKIVDQYINGLGADAGCDEGPGYWEAAGGCVYDVLNLLFDATGGKINIYHDPFIQKMGTYIYKTHISGKYFINVADAHPMLQPNGLMIYRFGKDLGYKPMMSFGAWAYQNLNNDNEGIQRSFRSRYLYNFLALKACAAYPGEESPVADVWYSDVQLMASRSKNDLFVSAHAGNNGESHNHNDVGDFTVYADGYPAIIDVGSGTYTSKTFSKDRYNIWFNTSAYHNLPVINGQEQKDGIKYTADNVRYQQNKNSSQLNMNIAKAYPAETGIKSWQRQVRLEKNKGIEVTDRYVMNTTLNSLTQTFMSVCDIDITKAGKIVFNLPNRNKVYLDYDAALWNISKEKMELKTPEDSPLKHSWGGKDIWRILLTSKFHDSSKSIIYDIHK